MKHQEFFRTREWEDFTLLHSSFLILHFLPCRLT